ncbi:MAG: DUF6788 family protein [Lentisphaeria bacterium]|jgi:hypothetical protein
MEIKLESQRTLAARRDARLKLIAQAKPFIAGSLAKVGVKCGNPNCKCASGERHEAWVLTRKEKGRTVTAHVPREMVAEWVAEHKRLKRLMKEASELGERMIRTFVRASRGAARGRARTGRPSRLTACC